MKIDRLKINGYGKLQDKQIDFKNGINIVYGENEKGKSTLINYIESMFFGLDKTKVRTTQKSPFEVLPDSTKYIPWDSSSFSGTLDFKVNDKAYTVFRDFNKKEVKIYDENKKDITNTFGIDKSQGSMFFNELTGIDRQLFENSFVSLQGKNVLDGENSKGLVQKISNIVSSGVDNVSYSKIEKNLKTRILNEIGTAKSNKKPINILENEINSLENKIKELSAYEEDKFVFENNLNKIKYNLQFYNQVLEILEKKEKQNSIAKDYYQKMDINLEIISNKETLKQELEEKITNIKDQIAELNVSMEHKKEDIEEKESKELKQSKISRIALVLTSIASVIASATSIILLKTDLKYLVLLSLLVPITLLIVNKNKIFYKEEKKQEEQDTLNETEKQIAQKQDELKNINAKLELIIQDIEKLSSDNEELGTQLDKIEDIDKNVYDTKIKELIKNDDSLKEDEKEGLFDQIISSNLSDFTKYINNLEIDKHKIEISRQNIESELNELVNYKDDLQVKKQKRLYMLEKEKLLYLALDVLKKSYDEMIETVSPKFENNLSSIISNITANKYNKIKYDEQKGFIANKANGDYTYAQYLSGGTVDQLYLALRLSMIDDFSNVKIPIILDEAFAYYDEQRLKSAFKFLSENYSNRQILVFTCSKREEQSLKELDLDYNVINI